MSRWKPPPVRSSPYISPAGYARLQSELETAWSRRRDVTAALAAAAAEGDRSENAEYIYRKKELRELDRRIRYLQKRLPSLKVVTAVSATDRIFFGARVTLVDAGGAVTVVRIAGPDEIDAAEENISVDSPLARALLSRSPGEHVAYSAAGRELALTIRGIEYP